MSDDEEHLPGHRDEDIYREYLRELSLAQATEDRSAIRKAAYMVWITLSSVAAVDRGKEALADMAAADAVPAADGAQKQRKPYVNVWPEVYGMMVNGHTSDSIANCLQLKPSRIRAILNGKRLQQALQRRHQIMSHHAGEQLRLHIERAVDAMQEVLRGGNCDAKRKAAMYIINYAQQRALEDQAAAGGAACPLPLPEASNCPTEAAPNFAQHFRTFPNISAAKTRGKKAST